MKRILIACGLLALAGCSTVGVQTYPVTAAQVQQMRAIVGAPPCPPGTTGVAMAVTLATGGGTVSIRCDVAGLVK